MEAALHWSKKSGLVVLGFLGMCSSSWAGFPTSINCGAGSTTDGSYVAWLSLGSISGFMMTSSMQTWIGYSDISQAAYQTFLNSGHPFAVHPEPSGVASSKYLVSPDRTMRLSWSDGTNQLPVQYRVYVGQTSSTGISTTPDLQLMGTTEERFFLLSNLTYLQDYFWRIEAFDTYGRATMSDEFTFSIAPGVGGFYCAPNPFKAGFEPTTFIFNFSGFGSARLSIYSLPHIDLVFSTTLDNVQDGVNTYVYSGKDGDNRLLYNGVYMAILEKRGTQKNETSWAQKEKFKFVVAK